MGNLIFISQESSEVKKKEMGDLVVKLGNRSGRDSGLNAGP